MTSYDFYTRPRNRVLADLRPVLTEEEYSVVAEAPLEWIASLYPEFRQYGPNVRGMEAILISLSHPPTMLDWQDYEEENAPRNRDYTTDFMICMDNLMSAIHHTQRGSTEELGRRYQFPGHLFDDSLLDLTLSALMVRDIALDEGFTEFTMDDYLFLTEDYRHFFGKIHPDDADVYHLRMPYKVTRSKWGR